VATPSGSRRVGVRRGEWRQRRFVDLRRGRRNSFQKLVEVVDALAARRQALGVQGPAKLKCHKRAAARSGANGGMPGSGESITTSGCLVGIARRVGIRDHRAMSWDTMSARSMPRCRGRRAGQRDCVQLSTPPGPGERKAMQRRSGRGRCGPSQRSAALGDKCRRCRRSRGSARTAGHVAADAYVDRRTAATTCELRTSAGERA